MDGSSAALDRVARTVSSVVFASDPVNDDTYGSSEWVAVRVKFDDDVLLTGSPSCPWTSTAGFGLDQYGNPRFLNRHCEGHPEGSSATSFRKVRSTPTASPSARTR